MKTPLVLAMVASAFLTVSPETSAQLPASAPSFEQRVQVDAVRSKKTRTEGGDFDDKLDRIIFTIKFKNTDTKAEFPDCKGEFYVLAQNIVNRKAFQLLGVEKLAISLPALGTQEATTEEMTTTFDTTGARFGSKYDGWVLVVRDSTGKVIMKKSTNPSWLPVAEKLGTMPVKSYFDQNLKKLTVVN
jgi:hypothetical protein